LAETPENLDSCYQELSAQVLKVSDFE
jgi:hypothetical protein